jgi:hypothetical protein
MQGSGGKRNKGFRCGVRCVGERGVRYLLCVFGSGLTPALYFLMMKRRGETRGDRAAFCAKGIKPRMSSQNMSTLPITIKQKMPGTVPGAEA